MRKYPLLDALINRRSRRFGLGGHLDGEPLAYESVHSPQGLTEEEEAALAFAACGPTGFVLGDLPYQPGKDPEAGGGNIMLHFMGRTVASADAVHMVTVFVINDDGAWMLKRPQDYPRTDLPQLIQDSREGRLLELYKNARIRIDEQRLDIPREVPFLAPFNKWSANVPGSTYFLLVNELTALYIDVLLAGFDKKFGYFLIDDRNKFQPAGLGKHSRSKGGHLYDDPKDGRIVPVSMVESWLCEFAAIEQGGMVQNLGLMSQAMGLGGFPHFVGHPFIWLQTLGFRMEQPLFSRVMGANCLMKWVLKAVKKDLPIPTPVGLEINGKPLLTPFCPPYYPSMEKAVLAFVKYKFAEGSGTLRDGGAATAWSDGQQIQAGIPDYSDEAIAATIDYCEYLYGRYGRFPGTTGPFRTVLAYQAHHVDPDFYKHFYRSGVLIDTHQRHTASWHSTKPNEIGEEPGSEFSK